MAHEREVLPYRTEARQESLGALRHPEAAHAALAFTRGLMAVFRTVVEPGTGFDEDVLDACRRSCQIARPGTGDRFIQQRRYTMRLASVVPFTARIRSALLASRPVISHLVQIGSLDMENLKSSFRCLRPLGMNHIELLQ